jgi:ABC-type transport system involved in multi-copper enzyme maturation permease subunit
MANQNNPGTRISKCQRIWAIASKDFVDGLKRRQMLSQLLTIIFLLALYRFLPLIGNANSPPLLVVFDGGDSELMQRLELSEAIQLRIADSYEDLLYQVGTEDRNTTGLVLPADFDQRAGNSEAIELEAYIDHWVDSEDEAAMETVIEAEIARLSGTAIDLRIERELLTSPDSGFSFYIAFGLLVVMWMMGMMVTPQLIVEEKTNRTIDALRVSPITEAELLTAKVLVGAVYCILTSSVVLVVYGSFVLHWWAVAGAILCGTFFIVSIGLLLGIKINDARQINLWTFIIFQPLLISMILGIFEAVSPGLRAAMRWLPTVAMGNAAAQSIAANVDLAAYLQSLLIMIVWGLAFFLIDAWLLRRMEQ